MARYTASAPQGLQGRPILLRHQLAYGGGNLLGSGALAISGAWLLYFYTTFCGLTLIEASFIFSVASIIDAISNPLMGYLTDNFGKTRLGKRFGRRRFFLLIGIPLMMFYPLLWVEGLGFWYYLCTYVVFEIIYTSIMVPYETLATEMTDDFSLRSKLTGYKAIFGKLANFLAAFIPGQFILLYGKESATPFFLTGLTYGVILIVAISCLWYCSWERPREGIYAGAMTFSGKILRSIIVFSMGAILSFYGFQSKAHTQPESAVTAIAVVFCAGVILLALAAIVFSKQMKLDRKAHLVVLQEVARIKAGGKIADIAPDVRLVVEDLVGHRYEECWGNSRLFKDTQEGAVQTAVSH